MDKEYYVESSRHDILPSTIDRFTTSGNTVADCDAQALVRFSELVFAKGNSWDDLALKRIDVKPVISEVAHSARLRGLRKRGLPDDYSGTLI